VIMLLFTSVRVTELVSIKLCDLNPISMILIIKWGKGGKRRKIPLKHEAVQDIRDYMDGEGRMSKFASSEYLLVTQRAPRADRDIVNKVFSRISRELNISMHPHKFRRIYCTRLLSKGESTSDNGSCTCWSRIWRKASLVLETMSSFLYTQREDNHRKQARSWTRGGIR
jgi:site-specific recombinase XerD